MVTGLGYLHLGQPSPTLSAVIAFDLDDGTLKGCLLVIKGARPLCPQR
jgi:hypothetical protein